ncbi:SET domain-containing protein [Fistulina hepatica ATCC 64428]|nr:SET domain-containing protein [Fistulina hepatica ATCC 64428]
MPSALQIRVTEKHGRGIFAKESISQGGRLLSTPPHMAVLATPYLTVHCSCCLKNSASALKRCTSCQTVYYCSPACQNVDWKEHKNECSALQRWRQQAPKDAPSIPSDAVRCMGRLLWTRARKQDILKVFLTDRTGMQPSEYELHTHLAQALVRFMGVSSPSQLAEFGIASTGELVDFISRFVTNSFAATTPDLTPIGTSVSPLVALINHSCDPNAVVVWPSSSNDRDRPLMHVVALKPVSPGEEILTSYIDVTVPTALRRKSLQSTYHFTCDCPLCSADTASKCDPRESISCPKSCGGRCNIPSDDDPLTRCDRCRAAVKDSDAVIDAARVGQEALDKATALQFSDPGKATQLTGNLIPILQSTKFEPSSHPLLGLSRLHQSLQIAALPSPPTQDALDDVIRTATRNVTGLTQVLCYGHPVRGIALAELGRLLAVDEPAPREAAPPTLIYPPSGTPRLKLAYDTLLRAHSELMVGFGVSNDGGDVGRQVRESIVTLEKELAVWKQGVHNTLETTALRQK